MNVLSNENVEALPNFGDRLQCARDQHVVNTSNIPNLHQWLQYWNDDESYAGNLRNIRHWIQRAQNS